ncbi:MAG TPA: hypothetical protein DFS52_06405, partial [Myxococcales bacterium]|nr:hypothetical protein [Myxococcales bacterium]
NAKSADGFTPLLAAMAHEQLDIAKMLLDKKCDTGGVIRGKRTALMIASAMGYTEIVKLMLA